MRKFWKYRVIIKSLYVTTNLHDRGEIRHYFIFCLPLFQGKDGKCQTTKNILFPKHPRGCKVLPQWEITRRSGVVGGDEGPPPSFQTISSSSLYRLIFEFDNCDEDFSRHVILGRKCSVMPVVCSFGLDLICLIKIIEL